MDDTSHERRLGVELAVGLGLAAATLVLFSRSLGHDFLSYDDPLYVLDNPRVLDRLSIDNILWSLNLRAIVAGNWHPVTVWSHMLDCQLFGRWPAGHHAVNVALHTVNTVLLFCLLVRMTGAVWPSALVAALFAWHPLHVESVAWISGRKDVLSTLFWFAALLAYARYAASPSVARYALVAVLLMLGMLSKPIVVTAPFVLLLLDWWPLRRFPRAPSGRPALRDPSGSSNHAISAGRLILEKVPLLGLSAVICGITIWAQHEAGALASADHVAWPTRWINAGVSYWEYLARMIWPNGLAVLYPLRSRALHPWQGAAAWTALALVCAAAAAGYRRRPYFVVGWLWYLGTLVPVIGIVQVGSQAMADRYTYVPLVGVFLMIAWTASDLAARALWLRRAILTTAVVWLALLAAVTWNQLDYWRDTETLFRRALQVTSNNPYAHYMVANELFRNGELDAALAEYDRALELNPALRRANYNKGVLLLSQRTRLEEAILHLQRALDLGYDPVKTRMALAECFARLERWNEAIALCVQVLTREPDHPLVILGLGAALIKSGRLEEAVGLYRSAVRRMPDDPLLAGRLAWILATCPDASHRNAAEAAALAERACQATDFCNARLLDVLAAAYAESGRYEAALEHAAMALAMLRAMDELNEENQRLAEALEKRIGRYQLRRPYHEDPALETWDEQTRF